MRPAVTLALFSLPPMNTPVTYLGEFALIGVSLVLAWVLARMAVRAVRLALLALR